MSFWDKLGKAAETVLLHAQETAIKMQQREEQRIRADQRRRDSAAYQHGRDDIDAAIVLSAPGRHEQKAGRPAAGQTGRTLNRTLKALNKADPKRFPSTDKDDYRIVNASDEVHYTQKTGRTEARKASLQASTNQTRLRRSLNDKSTIVALGSKAQETLRAAGITPTHTGSHPSMQNINRNYAAKGTSAAERAEERITRYAEDVQRSAKSKKKPLK